MMTGFFAVVMSLFLAVTASAGLSDADIADLQKELKAQGATFTVGPSSATERDLSDLCGLVPPKDWWIDDGSGTWSVEDEVYKMKGSSPAENTVRYSYYDGNFSTSAIRLT